MFVFRGEGLSTDLFRESVSKLPKSWKNKRIRQIMIYIQIETNRQEGIDINIQRQIKTDRERQRQIEIDTDRQRQIDIDKYIKIDKDIQRQIKTDRETQRQIEIDIEVNIDRQRQIEQR